MCVLDELIFTPDGYKTLEEKMRQTAERLAKATDMKAQASSGQDGWHDEGFKIGLVEEMMWSRELGRLQELMVKVKVVELEEQNTTVQLGNGVIVERDDGSIIRFVMSGYMSDPGEGRVSIYSPVGQALMGATEGEERALSLKDSKQILKVIKILPPSMAEDVLSEHDGGENDES